MPRAPLALLFALTLAAPALAGPDDADEGPSAESVDAAIQRACTILLANQELYVPDPPVGGMADEKLPGWQEGEKSRLAKIREASRGKAAEWPYEGVYRVGPDGRIPPGYRVGGSAIVCEALLEAPGFDDARREAIERSTRFMLAMIANDEGMEPKSQSEYDVRGWGQAYALKFFLRALEKDAFTSKKLEGQVKKAIPHLIHCLEVGQVSGGGWNYAGRRFSPFMTGSTLLALFHAREAGYEVPEAMVESALTALEAGRGESTAYAYSGPLRDENEPMQGSAARSAIAELALYRAGRSSEENLRKAVDGFFTEENWKALLVRKGQQGTHKPPYGVAPYYFYFGHTYAALAAEHLPEKERAEYRTKMRNLLWRTIEDHGGWNDRIFPRTESYSTAMAVLSLIAESLPAVKEWKASEETRADL